MVLWARRLVLGFVVAALPALSASAQDSALKLVQSNELARPSDAPQSSRDQLNFSVYKVDGDSHETIAVDIISGEFQKLTASKRVRKVLASNDQYLIRGGPGNAVWQLEVVDRSTQQIVARRGLNDGGSWAQISGDELILVQFASREQIAPVLHYSLPDLQLRKTAILRSNGVIGEWEDKLVTVRRNSSFGTSERDESLAVLDRQFNEIASIPMPRIERLNCAVGRNIAVQEPLALILMDCGRLAVFDLPAASLTRVFEIRVAGVGQIATIEGVMFAKIDDMTRVFDVYSGVELMRINLAADGLAASGGRILAWQDVPNGEPPQYSRRWSVYEPDITAIRSEDRRLERIESRCRTGDGSEARSIDTALDECDAAGMLLYAHSSTPPERARKHLDLYTNLLARSLARFREAAPLLERGFGGADRETLNSLVARKSAVLRADWGGSFPGASSAGLSLHVYAEYRGGFGFQLDRAYALTGDCDSDSERLNVFDRDTLVTIQSIVVNDCKEYGEINSLTLLPGFAVIDYSPEREDGEQNSRIVTVDLSTMSVRAKGETDGPFHNLILWNDRLVACWDGSPRHLDPATAKMASDDEDARICASRPPQLLRWGYSEGIKTANYWVELLGQTVIFHPQADSSEFMRQNPPRRSAHFAVPADGDQVILGVEREGGARLRVLKYDISTGAETVLFDLPTQKDARIQARRWRNLLILAGSVDILIYDLDKRFVATHLFAGDFVSHLQVDRDQLIVLTPDHRQSRVIDLPALAASFAGTDFFGTPDR
jgi:hypothetical protein